MNMVKWLCQRCGHKSLLSLAQTIFLIDFVLQSVFFFSSHLFSRKLSEFELFLYWPASRCALCQTVFILASLQMCTQPGVLMAGMGGKKAGGRGARRVGREQVTEVRFGAINVGRSRSGEVKCRASDPMRAAASWLHLPPISSPTTTRSGEVGSIVNTVAAKGPCWDSSNAWEAGSSVGRVAAWKAWSMVADAAFCQPRSRFRGSSGGCAAAGAGAASGHAGGVKPMLVRNLSTCWRHWRVWDGGAPDWSWRATSWKTSGVLLWMVCAASCQDAQKAAAVWWKALRRPKPPCVRASRALFALASGSVAFGSCRSWPRQRCMCKSWAVA